jgi:endonuclease-3
VKRPFRFGVVLRRIREHLQGSALADAAMFELAERGHRSLFEQLVACVISIRTYDETMLPLALKL